MAHSVPPKSPRCFKQVLSDFAHLALFSQCVFFNHLRLSFNQSGKISVNPHNTQSLACKA